MRYQQAASEAGDRFGFYALDVEFHRLIISALGFVQAVAILESLRAHLERLRRLLLVPPGRMPHAFAEHQAIVVALESGQRQPARQAMREHLEKTTRLFEDFARTSPDLFAA